MLYSIKLAIMLLLVKYIDIKKGSTYKKRNSTNRIIQRIYKLTLLQCCHFIAGCSGSLSLSFKKQLSLWVNSNNQIALIESVVWQTNNNYGVLTGSFKKWQQNNWIVKMRGPNKLIETETE